MKKGILLLFLFLLISFTISTAQVKIKERVTLDSKNKKFISKNPLELSDSEYWPCGPWILNNDYHNPWQVVWINSTYPFDVAQQAFNYQENNSWYSIEEDEIYSVEILEGEEICDFIEVYECDSVTGRCPEIWGQILPSKLDSIHGEDMIGDGDIFYMQGVPDRSVTGFVRYRMLFIDEGVVTIRYTNQKTMGYIDYHTLVVIPDYNLKYSGYVVIPHGERVSIYVDANPDQCSDVWAIFNGGTLPWYTSFDVQELYGTQYGLMQYEEFDFYTGNYIQITGSSFTGLYDTRDLNLLTYGELPDDSSYIGIQYIVNYPGISPITVNLKVVENQNYPIKVNFDPPFLEPGDSAIVTFMRRFNLMYDNYSEPTYVPFDDLQTFDVEIIKGGEYATLLSDFKQQSSDYFEDILNINYRVGKCLFLVANDTIDLDTADIVLEVSAEPIPDGTGISSPVKKDRDGKDIEYARRQLKRTKNSTDEKLKKSIMISGESIQADVYDSYNTIMGIGNTKIVKPYIIEMMLGETKYFEAYYPNPLNDSIVIREIEVALGETPQLEFGITEDVWGNNPVEKLGDKSGVYWEKKDATGQNLQTGLIRIIGRFWEEGKEFKSILMAEHNGNIAETMLMVSLPSELLSEDQTPAFNKYLDVNNNTIDIDKLCIRTGGKYGILPQIIKGQILHEAAVNDFGGSTGIAFTPSYRYEPFTTQWNRYLKDWSGRFYFKDSSSVDYSDVPEHQNVFNLNYIKNTKTVWDIIKEHSQLVDQSNSAEYGKRKADNTMNFYPKYFKFLQNKYDKFLQIYEEKENLVRPESADSANRSMINWLKTKWKNGKAVKTIAQTRCASSYGLVQMLYTTAVSKIGYNKDDVPENLNLIEFFDMFIKYEADLLSDEVTSENNWLHGYEESIKEYVFQKWNSAETYPQEIINNSLIFYPQK